MRRQTNPLNNNKRIENKTRLELRQGSQRNRRLALQMANRPSVLAALRTNQQNNGSNASVKQRLGNKRFNNQLNPFNANRNRRNVSNFNTNGMNRNTNQKRRNNTQNIGVIVGLKRKGLQRNRLRRTQTFKTTPNVSPFKPKRRVGPNIRNQNQAKIGIKKKLRINRNFNNRDKAQNQQKRRNVKPNREQLDNDLDAYMARTKSHLDAELDAYMSQTN